MPQYSYVNGFNIRRDQAGMVFVQFAQHPGGQVRRDEVVPIGEIVMRPELAADLARALSEQSDAGNG